MQPMNEMTREQAISKLQEERDLLEGEVDIDGSDWTADLRQALEMGIEALREPRTKSQKEYMKRGNVAKNQSPPRMTTEEMFVKLYGMNWKEK